MYNPAVDTWPLNRARSTRRTTSASIPNPAQNVK
jgi:hypothetical protein